MALSPPRWQKHTDLGSLNIGMSEAGEFVGSLETYMYVCMVPEWSIVLYLSLLLDQRNRN
jgi:hypothetical protein